MSTELHLLASGKLSYTVWSRYDCGSVIGPGSTEIFLILMIRVLSSLSVPQGQSFLQVQKYDLNYLYAMNLNCGYYRAEDIYLHVWLGHWTVKFEYLVYDCLREVAQLQCHIYSSVSSLVKKISQTRLPRVSLLPGRGIPNVVRQESQRDQWNSTLEWLTMKNEEKRALMLSEVQVAWFRYSHNVSPIESCSELNQCIFMYWMLERMHYSNLYLRSNN